MSTTSLHFAPPSVKCCPYHTREGIWRFWHWLGDEWPPSYMIPQFREEKDWAGLRRRTAKCWVNKNNILLGGKAEPIGGKRLSASVSPTSPETLNSMAFVTCCWTFRDQFASQQGTELHPGLEIQRRWSVIVRLQSPTNARDVEFSRARFFKSDPALHNACSRMPSWGPCR